VVREISTSGPPINKEINILCFSHRLAKLSS
jgi:hypothetical protein